MVRCHQRDGIEHQRIDLGRSRRLLGDDDGVATLLDAGAPHRRSHQLLCAVMPGFAAVVPYAPDLAAIIAAQAWRPGSPSSI
jgi:hypothetical protein